MTQYNMATAAEQVLKDQSAYMTQLKGVEDSAKGFFAAQYVADQAEENLEGLQDKSQRASKMLNAQGTRVKALETNFNSGDHSVGAQLANARSAYTMAEKQLTAINARAHSANAYNTVAQQVIQAFEAGNSYEAQLEQSVASSEADATTAEGIDAMFYQNAA